MEETIIDDCNRGRSESFPVSTTDELQIVERPSELGCADDKKPEGKCGHFSIRGYVAEIRKKEWKISWPFSLPDDYNKLDEDGHWLPPLHIPDFGCWRCPSCLLKLATGADTCAGVGVNCFYNKAKDDCTCYYENAILGTHDNSGLEMATAKMKGNELPKCHKQCSTRDEALNFHFSIEIPTPKSNNAYEFCREENIERGRGSLVKMKEKHEKATSNHGMSQKVDEAAKNDDPLNVVIGPSSGFTSMGLYGSRNNFSENRNGLAERHTFDPHIAGQVGPSNENWHQKRPQKKRLLTEIIKGEVSDVSKKILIFNKDAEINSIHTASNNSKAESDAFKDLDLHLGFKSRPAVHKGGKTRIMGKKPSRTPQTADKGPSLMSWLKDAAGKRKIRKRYGEGKQVAPAAVHSKSTLKPCRSEVITERTASKLIARKKQNKMNRVEDEQLLLSCRRESTSGNVKTNAGNGKHFRTGVVQSKSTEALPGLGAPPVPNCGNAILSKKKNKIPRIEEGTFNLMHGLKDSWATCNYDSVTDFEVNQQASHKYEQRTSMNCEKDSFDDIPMEIVELMAKNQHERHQLDAEGTSGKLYRMEEANVDMKVSNMKDFTEICGIEVAGFLLEKNSSLEKPQSRIAGSGKSRAGKKVGRPGKKLNRQSSRNCGKYNNIHSKMPQPEQPSASKGFVPFSQCPEKPLSAAVQFPVTVSDKTSDRWSLTCMQFLEAYHKSRTVSRGSSCGQTNYDGLLIPSNSMQFDNNISHAFDDLSHKSVVCHCTNPLPKRINTNSYGNFDLGSKCPDSACLQKQKGKAVSEIDSGNVPTYAVCRTEQGNKYDSIMGSLDMHTNEGISVMNLLRLMDGGACSSTPVEISTFRKQAISIKKHEFSHDNHHKEFFGVEDGAFRTDNSMHPKSLEFFNRNHQQGSSCEPFSPVHKISELGSSLHNNAADFHKSIKDGFISEISNDATSSEIHRRKTKGSLPSTLTRCPSSHRILAQDVNLGNAKERLPSTSDSVGESKNEEMTQSMKNCCMTELCTTSRNPAEFTIPGAGNAFMIGSEDLKYTDMFPSGDKLRVTTNRDGHKRRRMVKLTAIQGH